MSSGATLPEVLAAKEVRRYVSPNRNSPLISIETLPEGDVVLVPLNLTLVVDPNNVIDYVNPPGGFPHQVVEDEGRTVLVITERIPCNPSRRISVR